VKSFRVLLAGFVLSVPAQARASFMSGDTLDAFANGLSWFILFAVPIAAIAAFLYVHVLPEVIAERNHHPHKHSIKVLCILSLFFGGMLWPFAWLWAYTKPVAYRAIYGSDRHEDYYVEMGEKVRAGALGPEELDQLRHELRNMESKGSLTPRLQRILADLNAPSPPAPAPAGTAREKVKEAI